MKSITLNELHNVCPLVIPMELDRNKQVIICEMGDRISENSLLFLTPRANGDLREIELDIKPYAIITGFDDIRTFGDTPVIKTKSVRRAIAFAYSQLFDIDYSKIGIIGITGTSGKSTTAQLIHKILTYNNIKAGLIGTGAILVGEEYINERFYSMTTPDPRELYKYIKAMTDSDCRFIVMEVSSHAIALEKIAPIPFEVCLFTNLSEEHRDFHRTMEEYLEVKLSLFNQAKAAIINIDDSNIRSAQDRLTAPKTTVGIIHRGDIFATDIVMQRLCRSSFFYRQKGLIFGVDLKLGGSFNIYNALMALGCAIHLGVKPTMAKQAINYVDGIKGRMEQIERDITIIIDYAHTPLSLDSLLKSINKGKNARQKLITVFGCGGEREKEKRSEMGRIAELWSDTVIITEDNSRSEPFDLIASAILSGIENKDKAHIISERDTAIKYAIRSAKDGDIVAIVGKGHEEYIVDKGGYRPFDERAIILQALKDRENAN